MLYEAEKITYHLEDDPTFVHSAWDLVSLERTKESCFPWFRSNTLHSYYLRDQLVILMDDPVICPCFTAIKAGFEFAGKYNIGKACFHCIFGLFNPIFLIRFCYKWLFNSFFSIDSFYRASHIFLLLRVGTSTFSNFAKLTARYFLFIETFNYCISCVRFVVVRLLNGLLIFP